MSPQEFESIDMSEMADDQVIADACEKNLIVVGCSGVEDELQEDIAEVI